MAVTGRTPPRAAKGPRRDDEAITPWSALRGPFVWPALILGPIFAVVFAHMPRGALHRTIDISLDVAASVVVVGALALVAYGVSVSRRRKGRIDAYLAQRSAERGEARRRHRPPAPSPCGGRRCGATLLASAKVVLGSAHILGGSHI